MASLVWSFKSRSVLFLLFAAIAMVACQEDCPEVNRDCDEDYTDIYEAYKMAAPEGRKLLGVGRNEPVAQQSMAPTLSNRRSLLAPMCSETDHSIEAIIACTNAMRIGASEFRDEFPCLAGWLAGYSARQSLSHHGNLGNAAQDHTEDQAYRGQLSHTGGDGSSVGDRVRRASYAFNYVSENVAYGYKNAKDVVLGWMCSDGHRENIMSCKVADIGVGMAKGRDGRFYHTQVFACPSGGRCGCSDPGPTLPSNPSPSSVPSSPRSSPPRDVGPTDDGPRDDGDRDSFFKKKKKFTPRGSFSGDGGQQGGDDQGGFYVYGPNGVIYVSGPSSTSGDSFQEEPSPTPSPTLTPTFVQGTGGFGDEPVFAFASASSGPGGTQTIHRSGSLPIEGGGFRFHQG